jgi:hypothetical protein
MTLYTLIEDFDITQNFNTEIVSAARRWFQFDTALEVTNGTLAIVTADLPAGGIIYARMTAETIAASQTRNMMAAWA